MASLTSEKLEQAVALVRESGVDAWVTFVRETSEGGDPVLPLLLDGGLTWQSALLVTREGKKVAIVGNYDADPLRASGDWDEVIPYVQGIGEALRETLDRLVPQAVAPRLAVNFSVDDVKSDGLSHGMYLLMRDYLKGTRFADSLESAEPIVLALRGRKAPTEIARIREAIRETDAIFHWVGKSVRAGMTEREVYDAIQARIEAKGFGYAWDKAGDPIVNSGPQSMVGHGIPSATIRIEPGHVFHIDLGVRVQGYASDIQSCWYAPHPGETEPPNDVRDALAAVTGAISAGAEALRPGVQGWEVDAAAREFLVDKGYPEYMHALGHQVGRMAHDGGGLLGPRWERYGRTPYMEIEKDQVYTIELGVDVDGRGYLGIEEMVAVTDSGIEWLSTRQLEMPLLGQGR